MLGKCEPGFENHQPKRYRANPSPLGICQTFSRWVLYGYLLFRRNVFDKAVVGFCYQIEACLKKVPCSVENKHKIQVSRGPHRWGGGLLMSLA